MALWGTKDNLVGGDYTPAAPTSVLVVGTASSDFWTADAQGGTFVGVATGTTILLGTEPGEDGFRIGPVGHPEQRGLWPHPSKLLNALQACT